MMVAVSEKRKGAYGNFVMSHIDKWTNYDNNAFYQSIKALGLQRLAVKGGLATNCDLKMLTPYIQRAKTILEVGAGYGRVVAYLLTHNISAHITGIERCSNMYNHLKANYKHYSNVKLIKCDLLELNHALANETFDLILWLWGGIYDFSSSEQKISMQVLAKQLNQDGTLVLDTLREGIIPLGAKKNGAQGSNNYILESNNATINVYGPSLEEINQYAFSSGFSHVQHINFYTDTLRERALHLFS